MQLELDFARRFRESADLMRSIAAGETDIRASGILDRIAAEYDRTAEELEALNRAHEDGSIQYVTPASTTRAPKAVRAA